MTWKMARAWDGGNCDLSRISRLEAFMSRNYSKTDTLVLYTHSAVWFPIEKVAQVFGLPRPPPFPTWANPKDVQSLLTLRR